MKPSIVSTSLAFVIVGAVGLFLGFAGLPKPTLIAAGGVAALAGVGLMLRLRVAWTAAMAYAAVGVALSAYRVHRAWSSGDSYVVPALWLALDAYLAVSLLAIRSKLFRRPTR